MKVESSGEPLPFSPEELEALLAVHGLTPEAVEKVILECTQKFNDSIQNGPPRMNTLDQEKLDRLDHEAMQLQHGMVQQTAGTLRSKLTESDEAKAEHLFSGSPIPPSGVSRLTPLEFAIFFCARARHGIKAHMMSSCWRLVHMNYRWRCEQCTSVGKNQANPPPNGWSNVPIACGYCNNEYLPILGCLEGASPQNHSAGIRGGWAVPDDPTDSWWVCTLCARPTQNELDEDEPDEYDLGQDEKGDMVINAWEDKKCRQCWVCTREQGWPVIWVEGAKALLSEERGAPLLRRLLQGLVCRLRCTTATVEGLREVSQNMEYWMF